VKKLKAIIEFATRLFGSEGFDLIPTLAISHEVDGTKPLIYYHN